MADEDDVDVGDEPWDDPLDVLVEAREKGTRVAIEKRRSRPEGWKPPGRKTRLTPHLRDQVVRNILQGCPQTQAARAAGVPDSTYFSWKERGDKARLLVDAGETCPPEDKPYLDFLEATEAARAEVMARTTSAVQRAALGGEVAYVEETFDEESGVRYRKVTYRQPSVRAMTWFLERSFPADFAKRIEVGGPDGGAIPVELEVSARERVKGKLAEMAERAGVAEPAEDDE